MKLDEEGAIAFTAFEDDYRSPGYDSSASGTRGTFDTITGVVVHDLSISELLAVPNGEPLVVLGKGGSEMNLAFTTSLHENIHWWQHIGTTAGFLHALRVPAQATQTFYYLNQLCAQVESEIPVGKPLVRNVSQDLPFEHPAWLATCRWAETEFGSLYLSQPNSLATLLGTSPLLQRFFVSSGHAFLCFYINTLSCLATVLDSQGKGWPTVDALIEGCNAFIEAEKPGFEIGTFADIQIGLNDLCEGQARISEMQLQYLIYERWDWSQFIERGYLEKPYSKAFKEFLDITGFPVPTSPIDATLNLFLLLCDIALNPAEGYPRAVESDGEFLDRTHPGMRFLRLCSVVAGRPEVVELVEQPGFENYQRASELLCTEMDWPTPTQVATEVVATIQGMPGFELLEQQLETGEYEGADVPVRFLCAQHYSLMHSKAQLPAFFCWPAWFMATTNEEEFENSGMGELYSIHQAPFLASSLTSGVDTIQIEGLSIEQRSRLANAYFGTHALYDLVWQWMYFRTPFTIKFLWKANLSPEEIGHISKTFQTTFGVDLARISR